MTTISVGEFRQNLAELMARIAFRGERVIVSKKGKPMVAMISLEDLRVLEELEDTVDVAAAEEALEHGEFMSYEDAMKEIGLRG